MQSISRCLLYISVVLAATISSSCAAHKYSNIRVNNGTQQETFEISSTSEALNRAVIFIGGIHNSHHYWDSWKESMRLAEVLTAGYNHDHSSATMPASAQELAEEIGKLQGRGVTEISIVAHSMGGLIAKAALDRIATDGKASDYTHIELHAFGTPWGGYALADILRYLPATEAVSMAIGYPMGPDIGPGSNFMKNLSKPLPANFELYLYVGSADAVAKPELSDTRRRYAEVEAIATSIIVIEDYEHTDYRKAGLNIVEASRKTTADDSKLGATGNYVVVARRVRVGTINRAEETRSVVH